MPETTPPAAGEPDPQRKYRVAVTALVILFAPISWLIVAAKYALYVFAAMAALALIYEALVALLL